MSSPQTPAPKETFLQSIFNFPGIYWLANWMEVVERFAYYGVRALLPVYMVLAWELGGPQFDHYQKGVIYGWWAIVQSFVPVLSGGFADRYGFKVNIAWATTIKIIGYILMGYAIEIGAYFNGIDSSVHGGAAGDPWTYPIFFLGAMGLAFGTAIFKPGLQGLIAVKMPKQSAALGWAIFYQMVNVGAFVGPLLAGYLRVLDWKYVFLACSLAISLNYIPLFFFKEPKVDKPQEEDGKNPFQILKDSLAGLLEPRILGFSLAFAGFWFMAYSLWDFLPNFVDDWVDSRDLATWVASFGIPVPTVNGGNMTLEWIVNFNPLLIMFFAFAFGWITGKVRSLSAILTGIAIATISIALLSLSFNGWWVIFAIGVFSIGEMTASPTKMRYLASIAPPGKEGLYMGYVNMTVGIGWSILNFMGGPIYDATADKVNLARKELINEHHMEKEWVDGLQKTDVLPNLILKTSAAEAEVRKILQDSGVEVDQINQILTPMIFAPLANELIDRKEGVATAGDITTFAPETSLWLALDGPYERMERASNEIESLREFFATEGLSTASMNSLVGSEAAFKETRAMIALPGGKLRKYLTDSGCSPDQSKGLLNSSRIQYFREAVKKGGEGLAEFLHHAELPDAEIDVLSTGELPARLKMALKEGGNNFRALMRFALEDPKASEWIVDEEVLDQLRATTMDRRDQTRIGLWDKYDPWRMWLLFAGVGVFSMFLMFLYDRWAKKNPFEGED